MISGPLKKAGKRLGERGSADKTRARAGPCAKSMSGVVFRGGIAGFVALSLRSASNVPGIFGSYPRLAGMIGQRGPCDNIARPPNMVRCNAKGRECQ